MSSYVVRDQRRMVFVGQSISENRSLEVDAVNQITPTIANGQTDKQILFNVDISELKAFAMNATVAMTVKTNSAAAPNDTFVLTANDPVYFWEGDTAIFSQDVTSLHVTNASGNDGRLEISSATNPAP